MPTDTVTALRTAAQKMRDNTTANLTRVRTTFGASYARGWQMGRDRAAAALEEQAGAIESTMTVTPVLRAVAQPDLRSAA